MNKRTLITACLLMMALFLRAQSATFEDATTAVKNMKVGWNLGNTFDSHKTTVTGVTETETLRGQPVTKPELMEMMKMAGFNAIRVPVTWYPHMDAAGNIDNAWMNRIKEVVDYVLSQGMYCIINVHHDTGKTDSTENNKKGWLRAKRENYNENKATFEKIWQQIATKFKDYNHLLLFEGYNELLDTCDSWNYPSFNTSEHYDEEVAESAFDAINSYAKSFVETVRATGGNNAYRNLIVSTYAAADARSEGHHNLSPVVRLNKPEQSNHIIFEVHTYPPIVDKDTDGNITGLRPMETIKGQINHMISNLKTHFVDRYNSPVIFGEWGTSNVDAGSGKTDYDARRDYMFQFVDYFVKKAKENDMATFYWMGLSDKQNRGLPAFNQADLAEKILKAYYGEDHQPMILTSDDYGKEGYSVTFNKQWAEINLATHTDNLKTDYSGIEVILEEKPNINGNLSFRGYSSLSSDSHNNHANITSVANRLDFSTVSENPLQRVTIIWRTASGTPNLKIRYVRLLRKDGGKEVVIPTVKTADKVTMSNHITIPKYIKSKISNLTYSTLYYGYENLVVPPYVTATAYRVENGKLIAAKTYEAGEIIPENTGVVLHATEENTYKFVPSLAAGASAEGSMMRGSDEVAQTTGGDKYYMLSLNRDRDPNSVGFYYGNDNGAAFTNGAHKAYLAVPANEAKAMAYPFNDEFNETTGIEIHEEKRPDDNRWYGIDGKLLMHQPTAKGIYIINGRKIVVK